MSPGLRSKPHTDAPRFELRALAWERVQVTLCLRAAVGDLPDPVYLWLRLDRDPGVLARPMRTWVADGDLLVRFNVIHGPGQMPLADGRWTLVHATAGSAPPAPVRTVDGAMLPACEGVRYPLAVGDYTVDPVILPDGPIAFDVVLSPPAPGSSGTAVDSDEDGRPVRPTTSSGPVRRLRVVAFKVLRRVLRVAARRNGRRILFSSDFGSRLGGNLAVVHDRMLERGLDAEYELLTLLRPGIAAGRSFGDRLRLPWLLARADVILLDDYQPVIYAIDDPSVRIIQLWHASGAFKTVGYSRIGKPGGPSPWSRGHKNYTAAIVSSEYDVPFYAEAFGIREERVVPTGIPRMDRFFDERLRASGRARALDAFPQARDRFTILFAPTFRGGTRDASYDLGQVDLAALHALAVEKDAVVILKLHPFVRQPLDIPPDLADRLVDATRTSLDVNDLLFAVDLLVTDYSSIVFEFSILRKPMLFFAYDLDAYIAERDFYVRFQTFVPGRIVRTFGELLDAIRRDDYEVEKVAAFATRHFAHLDGGSTDRVIDLALGR